MTQDNKSILEEFKEKFGIKNRFGRIELVRFLVNNYSQDDTIKTLDEVLMSEITDWLNTKLNEVRREEKEWWAMEKCCEQERERIKGIIEGMKEEDVDESKCSCKGNYCLYHDTALTNSLIEDILKEI